MPANNTIPTEQIQHIIEFWFGTEQSATAVAAQKTPLWWSKDQTIDREITQLFQATSDAATAGALDHWAETPRGLLALIIATDQFPRNMYRDIPRAFASDPVALAFAQRCVDSGFSQQLTTIERVFAYLPFEHSEDLEQQQRSVALYRELADAIAATPDASQDEIKLFATYLDFAQQHHDIIQRFARFPHRNHILTRNSSEQEQAFLSQPGSSF